MPRPHPYTRGPSNSSRRAALSLAARASSIGVFRIACPIISGFSIATPVWLAGFLFKILVEDLAVAGVHYHFVTLAIVACDLDLIDHVAVIAGFQLRLADRAGHSLKRASLGGGLVYVGQLMHRRLVLACKGDAALVGVICVIVVFDGRLRGAAVGGKRYAGTDEHHHGDRHC